MPYAAIAIALLALIVALAARSKAAGLAQAVEDSKADARRRAENAAEEAEEKVAAVRRTLAQVVGGAKLTPEMVLEGRLWRDVSTDEGKQMVARGSARLIDVRTPQETAGGIIPGALLIPVQEIESRWKEIPKDGKPTLVYCAGGGRSAAACEFLSHQGYENLHNLAGGFSSWNGPSARPG